MTKVFNSTFENSLRMLLLLERFRDAELLERLYVTDFLAIYGKDFGITQENLNGDNDFKYSEFQTRKRICEKALKELVLDGMVFPYADQSGILYRLTDDGRRFAESLQSEYAAEYRDCADKAISYTSNYTTIRIIKAIHKIAADSVRGDGYE